MHSSRTSRLWWIARSTSRQPRGYNSSSYSNADSRELSQINVEIGSARDGWFSVIHEEPVPRALLQPVFLIDVDSSCATFIRFKIESLNLRLCDTSLTHLTNGLFLILCVEEDGNICLWQEVWDLPATLAICISDPMNSKFLINFKFMCKSSSVEVATIPLKLFWTQQMQETAMKSYANYVYLSMFRHRLLLLYEAKFNEESPCNAWKCRQSRWFQTLSLFPQVHYTTPLMDAICTDWWFVWARKLPGSTFIGYQ